MIGRLKGKKYTITRSNEDGHINPANGVFVPGATTTLQIMGSVQPLTAQDLVSIPEGDRTKERVRFYSFPILLNNRTAQMRKGDDVSIDGAAFRVESVEHWPNYSKCILAKVNSGSD